MSEQAITTIDFHGSQLKALGGDRPETTLVVMKPFIEGMGLDWKTQFRKLKAHPVLSKSMVIMTIETPAGPREAVALPLAVLGGWQMTVNANKVDPALRDNVILWQTEANGVLFDHFFGDAFTHRWHEDLTQADKGAIGGIVKGIVARQFAEMAEVMVEQGRELADLRQRLDRTLSGFDQSQGVVTKYVPMLHILIGQKVGVEKRRDLSRNCSFVLRRWCIDSGQHAAVETCKVTGRYLFQTDVADLWIREHGGMAMIRAHKDLIAGQYGLALDAQKKSRRKPPKLRVVPGEPPAPAPSDDVARLRRVADAHVRRADALEAGITL